MNFWILILIIKLNRSNLKENFKKKKKKILLNKKNLFY